MEANFLFIPLLVNIYQFTRVHFSPTDIKWCHTGLQHTESTLTFFHFLFAFLGEFWVLKNLSFLILWTIAIYGTLVTITEGQIPICNATWILDDHKTRYTVHRSAEVGLTASGTKLQATALNTPRPLTYWIQFVGYGKP